MNHIINKYRNKYHEPATQIVQGTSIGAAGFAMGGFNFMGGLIGIGSALDTGVKFLQGYLKNQEAFDTIERETQ